jgi:hypothetical protein
MAIEIRQGGTWKEPDDIQIKPAGSWVQADSVHIRVGGVWKEVWVAGAFDISNIDGNYQARDSDGQTVTGSLLVGSTGNVDWTGDFEGTNENDDWWLPNGTVLGTWHVKLAWDNDGSDNQRSGGTADNTWVAVGSFNMSFSKASAGGPDFTSGNYTLSFSDDGGSTTHDSVGITIILNESSP